MQNNFPIYFCCIISPRMSCFNFQHVISPMHLVLAIILNWPGYLNIFRWSWVASTSLNQWWFLYVNIMMTMFLLKIGSKYHLQVKCLHQRRLYSSWQLYRSLIRTCWGIFDRVLLSLLGWNPMNSRFVLFISLFCPLILLNTFFRILY